MNEIQIIVDGCADLPNSVKESKNISIIPFSVFIDGKEVLIDSSKTQEWIKSFYKQMRDGEKVKTLPATEFNITKCFQSNLDKGKDLLYICACTKQSNEIDKANRVFSRLQERYPDQKMIAIDSLNASIGIGLLAEKALKLAEEGKEYDDIVKTVSDIRNNVVELCVTESLKYLSYANKVKASVATFGDIFNVVPILTSDKYGNQCTYTKSKGRERSMRDMIKLAMEKIIDVDSQTIYVVHADDEYAANFCVELLKENGVAKDKICKMQFCPVIGAATGPGTVAVFGWGEETTFVGDV